MSNRPRSRRTLEPRVSVTLTLPAPLAERLREQAERLGVSRSLVAGEALERGFKAACDALRGKLKRARASSGARRRRRTAASNGDGRMGE